VIKIWTKTSPIVKFDPVPVLEFVRLYVPSLVVFYLSLFDPGFHTPDLLSVVLFSVSTFLDEIFSYSFPSTY